MKKVASFIAFICFAWSISALSVGDVFSNSSEWFYYENESAGFIRVQVKILDVDKEKVTISVQKDMTPFPEVLYFTVTAEQENEKYVFSAIDNWGNSVFGYIKVKKGMTLEDELLFYLDQSAVSDEGKNIGGHLYGDTVVLKRGSIIFD